MDKVSDIKQAFNSGSGLEPLHIATIAVAVMILVLFLFSISIILKRLQMFQKDQNADELFKMIFLVFLLIIIVMTFSAAIFI